MNISYYLKICY